MDSKTFDSIKAGMQAEEESKGTTTVDASRKTSKTSEEDSLRQGRGRGKSRDTNQVKRGKEYFQLAGVERTVENEDENLSSGQAPREEAKAEKKNASNEKSAKKRPRKVSGAEEIFLQEPSLLHMGKYHSMFAEGTSTSARRLYSPQVTNRFQATAGLAKKKPSKPYIIGICGGPSSGKSTVARMLKSKLPNAVVLNLINFYHPVRGNLRRRSRADSFREDAVKNLNEQEMKSELRKVYRDNDFDSPDAIDWTLFNFGLEALLKRQPFNQPIYDSKMMQRSKLTEHIKPSDVVIIEGHLIFCNEDLRNKMDLKVFIDTDDDVRLSRRVLKMSRKYPGDKEFLAELLHKYERFVKPSFEKFIEPTKKYSDIILPNYGFSTEDKIDIDQMNIPALDLIIKRVEADNV